MASRPRRYRGIVIGVALLAITLASLAASGATSPKLVLPQAMSAAQAGPKTPDLALTMLRSGRDSRALAVPDRPISISIGVNNLRGGIAARGVRLTVKLPAGVALENAMPAASAAGASSYAWDLGTIKAGAFPRLIQLNLKINGDVQPHSRVTIGAGVATTDQEDNLQNNSDALTLAVEPAAAAIALNSDLDAVALTADAPTRFTVDVSSVGTVTAGSVTLSMTPPAGVSFVSSEPAASVANNSVEWRLGDMEPGGMRTVGIGVAIDKRLAQQAADGVTPATIRFEFGASTTTTAATAGDHRLVVDKRVERAGHDLKLWLTVAGAGEPGELVVGSDVDYVVDYGNFGNRSATAAKVTVTLPSGLVPVSPEPAKSDGNAKDNAATRTLSWDVGDVRVGESRTIRTRVHVASIPPEGALATASISASGRDIDPENNRAVSLRRAARIENKAPVAPAVAQAGTVKSESSSKWIGWAIPVVGLVVIGGLWLMIRNRKKPTPPGS